MSDWLAALADAQAIARPAVLVTVIATRGSVPRTPGTHMVVTAEGLAGTIGGGHLEFQAIAIARDLIGDAGELTHVARFPLGASLGQCCGGVVTLLFEPVNENDAWVAQAIALRAQRTPCVTVVTTTAGGGARGRLVVTADAAYGEDADTATLDFARRILADGGPARTAPVASDTDARRFHDPVRDDTFEVVLFGAGHVGRAVARTLADLPCRVRWIDTRDGAFPADVPRNATTLVTDAPEDEVDAASDDVFFLVMTHEHAQDERIAERILARHAFAYFGLIGSQSKRRQFEARMARRGMPPERFASMTCPIGVTGITGKAPAVIAVAVAAQLLQVWSERGASARPGASETVTAQTSARAVGRR